jgi:uncharacterized protein (TIGR02466 family)
MAIVSLFSTRIYRGAADVSPERLRALARGVDSLAEDDEAGRRWCEEKGYPGYTSYGSVTDLAWRNPDFAALRPELDRHAAAAADAFGFDLGSRPLALDNLWVNILEDGGFHSGHIHPGSVLSGTLYLAVPDGAAPIKFEDPRLPMMMAAPPRRPDCADDMKSFVTMAPAVGEILLWESWLRHEVALNETLDPRVSVSFNFRW